MATKWAENVMSLLDDIEQAKLQSFIDLYVQEGLNFEAANMLFCEYEDENVDDDDAAAMATLELLWDENDKTYAAANSASRSLCVFIKQCEKKYGIAS